MDDVAEYHRGSQDISGQVATYKMFDGMTKWGSLTVAVGLLMCTLWFCLGMGFLGGLIPGIVLAAVGVWFLRDKPAGSH